MRASRLLLPAVVLAIACGRARAQDDPPADSPPPTPAWAVRIFGDLAVSRDGKWLAGRTRDGFRLFPAAGGEPIALDLGKDELGGDDCEFTADSKWVVVTGSASGAVVKGIKADTTQSVLVFSTDAPAKRKTLQIALKAKALPKDVKRLMDPSLRGMKTLEGEVGDLIPLTGSRVVFDRGSEGMELWDVAAGSKYAAPASVDTRYFCGLSADGTLSVSVDSGRLEIRDVKSNRVVRTISTSESKRQAVRGWYPAFTPDGSSVLVARFEVSVDDDSTRRCSVECWSTVDGTKRWEVEVGEAKFLPDLDVCGGYAAVVLDETVHLLALRDGETVAHELGAKKVSRAEPSADGKALWIVDSDSLTRLGLPPLAEK